MTSSSGDLEFLKTTGSAPDRCAFCRQVIDAAALRHCPRCDASYHGDCWEANSRRCALYGCEPAPKPAASVTAPRAPASSTRGLGVILFFALIAVLRLLSTGGQSASHSSVSSADAARSLCERAEGRVNWGDVVGAEDDYTEAIGLNPSYALPYGQRALLRIRRGDFKAAIDDASKAISLDPSSGDAWRFRGYARDRLGQADGAIEDWTRAIELNPKDATALRYRGVARQSKRQLDLAIEDFSRTIEVDPTIALYYLDRGMSRRTRGDLEEARTDLKKCLELARKGDPEFEIAHAELKALERGR